MRLTTALSTLLCASLVAAVPLWAQGDPPKKLESPDGKFTVEIADKALPGSDSLEDFTLILSSGGKPVAQVPTFGFLIAAHWSDDGKYVAVNNRRGNSGDYVWVFDLHSGKALKKPDDTFGEAWQKAAAQAVRAELAAANEDTLVRDWVTAQGWKGGQLNVVVRSVYRGAPKKYDFEFLAEPATWQVKSSKLVKKGLEE
jgi:hypothetical protein